MLSNCGACQSPISAKAVACPKCGHPVSSRWRFVRWGGCAMAAVGAAIWGFGEPLGAGLVLVGVLVFVVGRIGR
jgi:hypothetical protein